MRALKVKTKNSGSLCDDKQDSYENSVNTQKYTWEAQESQIYLVKILPLEISLLVFSVQRKQYH